METLILTDIVFHFPFPSRDRVTCKQANLSAIQVDLCDIQAKWNAEGTEIEEN